MSVHIYATNSQPATRWRDALGGWHRSKPRALCICWNCKRRRWAKNCVVHAYYDTVYGFCKQGYGCKTGAPVVSSSKVGVEHT